MRSVTQRINVITQPKGGYIPVKIMTKLKFDNHEVLSENENIAAGLVGLAVDQLTRFYITKDVVKAFDISLIGAMILDKHKFWYLKWNTRKAKKILHKIGNLNDDETIIAAYKLAGYDVYYRSSTSKYRSINNINPDHDTIQNIKIMVKRSLTFLYEYGPVTASSLTLEGGYTLTVGAGDSDYLTKDGLWDFKVTKGYFTNKHTLQILMYYLMGIHSKRKKLFEPIDKLGLFNPRKTTASYIEIKDISKAVIDDVCKNVIGYYS